MDRRLKDRCRVCVTSPPRLREGDNRFAPETRSGQLAFAAASRTPVHPFQAAIDLSGAANNDTTTHIAKIIGEHQISRRDRLRHLFCLYGDEDHHRPSIADRGWCNHQAMGDVRGAPIETLHATTSARAATTLICAFQSEQPSSPSAHLSSFSKLQEQSAGFTGAAVEQTPEAPEEEDGDSTHPHADAQLFAVIDEVRSACECTGIRWEEVGQHRADRRARCGCVQASCRNTGQPARYVPASGWGSPPQ
ncbi:uncharacterized protein LOC144123425 [Amblyomma americanum]